MTRMHTRRRLKLYETFALGRKRTFGQVRHQALGNVRFRAESRH